MMQASFPAAIPHMEVSGITSLKGYYESRRDELRLTDRQICRILNIDPKSLKPILDGSAKQINLITIIKLGHFLGLSVDDIVRIYMPQMSPEQIGDIQHAKETGYITRYFDIVSLQKENILQKNVTSEQICARLCQFFGLESIYDFSGHVFDYALSKTKRGKDTQMRDFWLKSAFYQFEHIANPYPYDRAALMEVVPKIKPYSRNEANGLSTVLRALYRVGVTVIYQQSFAKLQVRGATIAVNGKPCIVFSDINKMYPTLWFTLMHELHHVLFDFEDIKKQQYHISDTAGDLFLMNEELANDFARRYFVDDTRMKFIKPYLSAPLLVDRYAREWGIHPSIIYAFHCFDTGEWKMFKRLIPSMNKALAEINTSPFSRETLMESVNEIKQSIYNL